MTLILLSFSALELEGIPKFPDGYTPMYCIVKTIIGGFGTFLGVEYEAHTVSLSTNFPEITPFSGYYTFPICEWGMVSIFRMSTPTYSIRLRIPVIHIRVPTV
tara:strand:- start:334 stop:642 length:309 start_codon:yes stop_codon:yes gene_type:complete